MAARLWLASFILCVGVVCVSMRLCVWLWWDVRSGVALSLLALEGGGREERTQGEV
jgi:hypothetical protein